MRIALTHPFCWPHVRRGTERYLELLTRTLVARGHEVTLISSGPAVVDEVVPGAGRRLLAPIPRMPPLIRARIADHHAFFAQCLRALLRHEFDVVHSFHITDAFAAWVARRWRGHRTVMQIHGPPVPRFLARRVPPERWMFARAIRAADRVVVPSRFVADIVREHYGVEAEVLGAPTDLAAFAARLEAPRGAPVLLSVADFSQRTKGVRVLVSAFAEVKKVHPGARLRLAGRLPEALRRELFATVPDAVAGDVECLGLGRPDALPELYREATVMVLPSMWEALPYVVFEAWACGTPVVVTNHGGAPEYVSDEVAVLFEPEPFVGEETRNVTGLTHAILSGIELGRRPGNPARCRAHAEQHAVERMAGQLEGYYHFD